MKNTLKQIVATLIIVTTISVAQEKSDYEITQEFQTKYKALTTQMDEASSVEQCTEIGNGIDELEKNYSSYKKMLDKALYPDDFTKKITDIRNQLKLTQERVAIIGTQGARIAELESQVDKLSGENSEMLLRIASLEDQAKADKKLIDSLSTMVTKLRNNIAQRDKMIFALVDSLFLQYDKMTVPNGDMQKQKLAAVEKNNVLTNIKKSVSDNMKFLESTVLTGEDVAKLSVEQQRFASQWQGVGPKLASIYLSSRDRAKEVPAIDTMVIMWGKKIDMVFWKTLNEVFSKKNISVKSFNNGTEFYTSVLHYIDEQIQNPNKIEDDVRYKNYQTLDEVWNKEILGTWATALKEKNIYSEEQNTQVKVKMETWHKAVEPSYTLIYVLVGVVLLGFILFIMMKMKKPKTEQTPNK